jgi:hypothetical protein
MEEMKTTEYITITVAEYHCLTKAAALLEVVANTAGYNREAVVDAVKATIKEMRRPAEAGADQ